MDNDDENMLLLRDTMHGIILFLADGGIIMLKFEFKVNFCLAWDGLIRLFMSS